jgi:hypothetical protein
LKIRKLTSRFLAHAEAEPPENGESVTIAEPTAASPKTVRQLRSDKVQLALLAIIVTSGAWSWFCADRGWYLQADFTNLLDAHRSGLTWGYLSHPIGGHFGPVGRLFYWLLDRLAPMSYGTSVGFRVVLQAVASWLLFRLVVRLCGRQVFALVVVGLFSVNPLLIATLAWLSSGLTLPLAEILILLALDLHVRRAHIGSIRNSLLAGILLALAVFAYDGAIVATLIFPVISVGCLLEGSLLQRCRAAASDWSGWLATALPVAVAVGLALNFADSAGAQSMSLGQAWHLINYHWTHAVAPTLIGGPWHWYADSGTYLPFAAPSDAVVVAGELAAVLMILLAARHFGWRVLTGLVIVAVVSVAGIVFAGVGRYATYSNLVAITPRYSAFVPLALAIGAAVTVAPLRSVARSRAETGSVRTRREIEQTALVAALVVVLAVSNMVSVARFTTIWARNPGQGYVENLVDSARAIGPSVNIYDTPAPGDILAGVEPAHYVSDLLALNDVPVHVDSPISDPLVAKADGHLVRADFVSAGDAHGTTQPQCGTYLAGAGVWTLPFDKQVAAGAWFLRMELFQAEPSNIAVQIVNRDGSISAPVSGAHLTLTKLEELNLRLPVVAPVAVRITTVGTATSLCLTRVSVGAPFPAS